MSSKSCVPHFGRQFSAVDLIEEVFRQAKHHLRMPENPTEIFGGHSVSHSLVISANHSSTGLRLEIGNRSGDRQPDPCIHDQAQDHSDSHAILD